MSRLLLPGILSQSFGVAQWYRDFDDAVVAGDALEYESWSPSTSKELELTEPSWSDSKAVGYASDGASARHFAKFLGAPESSEIEIYGVTFPSGTETDLYVGGSPGYDAYLFQLRNNASEFRLAKIISGTFTALKEVSRSFGSAAKVRGFWSAENSELKMKVWPASESEPADWDIETTDSSITTAGTVGIFTFSTSFRFAEIGIGINGSPAPTGPV